MESENPLFDWDTWDQFDTAAFTFYNVNLKVPVGDFEIGESFPTVNVDYERGVIEFITGDHRPNKKYHLHLVVGKEIQ